MIAGFKDESATSRTTGLAGRRGGRGGSREHQTSRTRGAYHKFFRVSILGMLISSVYSKNRAKDSPVVFQLYPEKWICWPSLFTQGNDWSKMKPPVVRVYLVCNRPLEDVTRSLHAPDTTPFRTMASTFVGAPAALRARVAPRRGSRDARALTRADASAQAVPAVTPSTVGSRCGSASVKGTVRKQNEDRFASYVSFPAHRRDIQRATPRTSHL